MPLVALHCPGQPFKWRTGEQCAKCLNPCMRDLDKEDEDTPVESLGCPEMVQFVWHQEFVMRDPDHYHNDPGCVSVTDTLYCLRKAYYNKKLDYAETPTALWARARGTAMHKAMEGANDPRTSEVELRAYLPGGRQLYGTADVMNEYYVADLKNVQATTKKYKPQEAEQLTIYDEMDPSPLGPRELRVYQGAHKGVATHVTHRVVGALENAKRRAALLYDALDSECPEMLPAEGPEIKFWGKKDLCDYCPHRMTCEAVEEVEEAV